MHTLSQLRLPPATQHVMLYLKTKSSVGPHFIHWLGSRVNVKYPVRQHLNQPEPTKSQVTWSSVSPAHTHAGMRVPQLCRHNIHLHALKDRGQQKGCMNASVQSALSLAQTDYYVKGTHLKDITIASCEQKNLIYWRTHSSNEQWYNASTAKVFTGYKTVL